MFVGTRLGLCWVMVEERFPEYAENVSCLSDANMIRFQIMRCHDNMFIYSVVVEEYA